MKIMNKSVQNWGCEKKCGDKIGSQNWMGGSLATNGACLDRDRASCVTGPHHHHGWGGVVLDPA